MIFLDTVFCTVVYNCIKLLHVCILEHITHLEKLLQVLLIEKKFFQHYYINVVTEVVAMKIINGTFS